LKIRIIAVGRNGSGPEYDLTTDYMRRATITGKSIGVNKIEIIEIDDRKQKSFNELGKFLLKKRETLKKMISLDVRGKLLTSESFAELFSSCANEKLNEICFFIGGPDGLPTEILQNVNLSVSFGRMTYPHQLLRAMLLEQIYRATTILSRHPYHRS